MPQNQDSLLDVIEGDEDPGTAPTGPHVIDGFEEFGTPSVSLHGPERTTRKWWRQFLPVRPEGLPAQIADRTGA